VRRYAPRLLVDWTVFRSGVFKAGHWAMSLPSPWRHAKFYGLYCLKLNEAEIGALKITDMKLQDMTRIHSILLNFSFFSCTVMLTLQHWNCVM